MNSPYETVELAVVLIGHDGRLLLDYNAEWSGFCLPITTIHDLAPLVPEGEGRREQPREAARRAAVEVLGRPLAPAGEPQPLRVEVTPYHQSGRDGRWKRYQFHVFGLRTDVVPQPLPGHIAVWMTPQELRTHGPVSPTVRHVLQATPENTLLAIMV
jgi:hypothetical protein